MSGDATELNMNPGTRQDPFDDARRQGLHEHQHHHHFGGPVYRDQIDETYVGERPTRREPVVVDREPQRPTVDVDLPQVRLQVPEPRHDRLTADLAGRYIGVAERALGDQLDAASRPQQRYGRNGGDGVELDTLSQHRIGQVERLGDEVRDLRGDFIDAQTRAEMKNSWSSGKSWGVIGALAGIVAFGFTVSYFAGKLHDMETDQKIDKTERVAKTYTDTREAVVRGDVATVHTALDTEIKANTAKIAANAKAAKARAAAVDKTFVDEATARAADTVSIMDAITLLRSGHNRDNIRIDNLEQKATAAEAERRSMRTAVRGGVR